MKNTFRVSFFAKKRKVMKSGRYMIYARISICGQRCNLSTTISVPREIWDPAKQRATGDSFEAINANSLLDHFRARVILSYNARINSDKAISPELIKADMLSSFNGNAMLLTYFGKFNADRAKQIGYCIKQSTHNKYELTIRRLREFLLEKYNVNDIKLTRIKLPFILNFESFLKMKYGLSNNSTERLIKIFKRIILIAKEEGLIQHNPFQHHKSKQNKPVRTFLNKQELLSIIKVNFDSKRLAKVKDLFLFCCFTGLSYSDLSMLKRSDIVAGCDNSQWIIINRQKTSTESRIKLLALPLRILEKYDYNLPVISNAKFNMYLREVMDKCNISKRITVHLARHTDFYFGLGVR